MVQSLAVIVPGAITLLYSAPPLAGTQSLAAVASVEVHFLINDSNYARCLECNAKAKIVCRVKIEIRNTSNYIRHFKLMY